MAKLANGVFGGSLPWHLLAIGMGLGVAIILLIPARHDVRLYSGFRCWPWHSECICR